MLEYLINAGQYIVRYTGQLSHTQWILVLVGAVIIGFVCLRGFGSRKNY